MFIDTATVLIQAGDGGDGYISFRHEKFVDRGGPDGGDGGNGGSIVVIASLNQNTLAKYRYKKELVAESGKPGYKQKMHGKSGKNLDILLPVGTAIYDANNKLIVDLTTDGQKQVIAEGGKGGFGNAHFVSSRRQAPRLAEKGEKGEAMELRLEMKLIADVGIVGLPNAGKSTFLSRVSNARPEIANYAFTTLTPNLGVADIASDSSLLLADVPGIIQNASKGKGLGIEFLRHIERTSVLLHLIDIYQDDIVGAYKTIQKELKGYKIDLSKKPMIIALNKIDGLPEDMLQDRVSELNKILPKKTKVYTISASSGKNVSELLFELKKTVDKQQTKQKIKEDTSRELPVLSLPDNKSGWEITKSGKKLVVTGKKIERFANRTDFSNDQGVARLRDIMNKMGIMHQLRRMDVEVDQVVVIGKPKIGEFNY